MTEYVPTRFIIEEDPLQWSDPRTIIFGHPSMEYMVDALATKFPQYYRKGAAKWNFFADGSPDFVFEAKNLINRRVIYIFNATNIKLLSEQYQFLSVIPRQGILSLDIILPFFGVGQMERVDQEGIIASAQPIAELISKIETTKEGRPTLVVFDIHALPERFYFTQSKVVVRMESAQRLLRSAVSFTLNPEWTEPGKVQISAVVYPDEGSYKRFKFFFEGVPGIICSKMRGEGDTRVVRIVDEKDFPADKELVKQHVLIIDDLVQSGGTLRECAEAIRKAGFPHVSAFVTHGVFPGDRWQEWIEGHPKCVVDNFFITNSTPVANSLTSRRPFTVLPLENEIHSFFSNYHTLQPHKQSEANFPLFSSFASPLHHPVVVVGSAKQQKLKSVYSAFYNLLSASAATGLSVVGFAADSKIHSQPFGREETLLGALNRANHAKELAVQNNAVQPGRPAFIVAIESGLVELDDKIYDIVALVVANFSDASFEAVIPNQLATLVPRQFFEQSKASEFALTAGGIMEKTYLWKDDKWHQHATGFDRSILVSCAIVSLVSGSHPSLPYHAPNTILYS